MTLRRALAAAAAALVVVPAASAAGQPVVLTLVDPNTNLTQQPPLASHVRIEQEARVFRQKVDSAQTVTVGIDATGRPVSLAVRQRLVVTGKGDYLYTVPAPVLSVVPTAGSASMPGRRQGAILWAGFSPGKRVLAADATLDPRPVASLLPLRVTLVGDTLTLENATATPAPTARGRGDRAQLVRALAGARRGVYPPGGVPIQVAQPVAARTATIEAPLDVRGEVRSHGNVTMRFHVVLGDGRPLRRTIRLAAGKPHLRIVATPVTPRRTLPSPAAARRLSAVRLLEVAEDVFLRNARAHQFRTFLANPGPQGAGVDTGRYVYVTTGAPRVAPALPAEDGGGGLGALAVALLIVGGVAVAGGLTVAWAHL